MLSNRINATLKYAALALLVPMGLGTSIVISAEPAFAERGNGNGNGNGSANRDQSDRGNSNREANASNRGNNGRGAIASELKSLNAAHASPTARASASPDSMPGKLNTYRETYLGAATAQQDAKEATDLFNALKAMTEDRFLELNPELDYATTLAEAEEASVSKEAALALANTSTQSSLLTLTEGRTLSQGALDELHTLLGL